MLSACTNPNGGPASGPQTGDTPLPSSSGGTQLSLPVIAASIADDAYLSGMRAGQQHVNDEGGIDGRPLRLDVLESPDPAEMLRSRISATPDTPMVFVVDAPGAVVDARADLEAARVPAMLVGGDLYSSRDLFRYAFQTAVPSRWQARVLASYLIEDRRDARTILIAVQGVDHLTIGEVFNEAWLAEGQSLDRIATVAGPRSLREIPLEDVDSVVFFGDASDAGMLSDLLSRMDDPPQLALSSEALGTSFVADPNRALPGTVATYTYAWSGWAAMLPRVQAFRERFIAGMGHAPSGLEQEGYDAVMAVADALRATGGRGGDPLVRALEAFREQTYASVPVRLGPDDHVLAEESHLGLFAVTDPSGAPPGEAFGEVPWRPVMRTFTTDGEKVNLLDRDKRIFFPFWRPKRPTPRYPRSEFGIVSRRSDPAH